MTINNNLKPKEGWFYLSVKIYVELYPFVTAWKSTTSTLLNIHLIFFLLQIILFSCSGIHCWWLREMTLSQYHFSPSCSLFHNSNFFGPQFPFKTVRKKSNYQYSATYPVEIQFMPDDSCNICNSYSEMSNRKFP